MRSVPDTSSLLLDGVDSFGNWCCNSLWGVLVQLHQLGEIELWLLEDLDLSDHAVVLEWVDLAAFSLDLLADILFQEHLDELFQGRLLNSCLDNFLHLLDDQLFVGALGIAGGLDLLLGSLGESQGEESQNETISSLDLHVGLNQRMPFLDHGASFIS